jgi:hypothetical protein
MTTDLYLISPALNPRSMPLAAVFLATVSG